MTISKQDIEQLARLARLELRADEVTALEGQLPSIVEYVGQLQSVEAPTLVQPETETWVGRADEAQPSDVTPDILGQAPERMDDFWKVDAVFT